MKNRLKKGWWKKEDKAGIGVRLRAISETPFAPFYAPAFPATKPMYGEASDMSPMPSNPYATTTPTTGGYTPSSATETGSTYDSSTTTTTAEEVTDGSKKNKKKRRK